MADGRERSIYNPVTGEKYLAVARSADTGGEYVGGRGFLPIGARPACTDTRTRMSWSRWSTGGSRREWAIEE